MKMAQRSADGGRATIPLLEEQAVVLKRKRITGAVRVRTTVREHEAVVEEPVQLEEIEVERVPVKRWVTAAVPVRQEGDTTIISLLEEVIVVEKRLCVVEEVRITKRRTSHDTSQRVTLRREEAIVEHLTAAADRDDRLD
jgi:uncharacterized protein (TIGR02271 family)